MKTEEIKKEDINKRLKEFRYHIIYYFDKLKFGEGDPGPEFDPDNINEAFLFDENKCMHIYREDGVKCVLFIYESNDKFIITEDQIGKKGREFKSLKKLQVKKFINFDEDDQAYIERVFPAKLIFE